MGELGIPVGFANRTTATTIEVPSTLDQVRQPTPCSPGRIKRITVHVACHQLMCVTQSHVLMIIDTCVSLKSSMIHVWVPPMITWWLYHGKLSR